MFQTDAEWEEVRYTPSLRELLQQPGLRRYPIVEFSEAGSILFLDLVSETEGPETGVLPRYICAGLATVVDVLSKNPDSHVILHMQIFDKESKEYSTHRIIEILLTLDERNNHFLVYRRDNGQLYIDGTNALYESSGRRMCTLWVATKI